MTLYLGSFINGLTHFLAKLRQMSRVSLFFMRKTFILALHQGKSVQNRGQSVILSGENHRLPYTITGGDFNTKWNDRFQSMLIEVFFFYLQVHVIKQESCNKKRSAFERNKISILNK